MGNNPEVQIPAMSAFTVPGAVDAFNKGDMVLIRKGGQQNDEEWKVLRVANKGDAFDVPPGWEIVEMDESNFGEYLPKVGHLITMTWPWTWERPSSSSGNKS